MIQSGTSCVFLGDATPAFGQCSAVEADSNSLRFGTLLSAFATVRPKTSDNVPKDVALLATVQFNSVRSLLEYQRERNNQLKTCHVTMMKQNEYNGKDLSVR